MVVSLLMQIWSFARVLRECMKTRDVSKTNGSLDPETGRPAACSRSCGTMQQLQQQLQQLQQATIGIRQGGMRRKGSWLNAAPLARLLAEGERMAVWGSGSDIQLEPEPAPPEGGARGAAANGRVGSKA
jgi:hypothetical protein